MRGWGREHLTCIHLMYSQLPHPEGVSTKPLMQGPCLDYLHSHPEERRREQALEEGTTFSIQQGQNLQTQGGGANRAESLGLACAFRHE